MKVNHFWVIKQNRLKEKQAGYTTYNLGGKANKEKGRGKKLKGYEKTDSVPFRDISLVFGVACYVDISY